MTKKHSHRAKERQERPFIGYSARPQRPNPAAHGGITIVEICRCGAVRLINVRGDQVEQGHWWGGQPVRQRKW